MSRSNPEVKPVNPATKFLKWNGDTGGFQYYDKEAINPQDASKKGANIQVPLPFTFIVLDQLITIKGFSDTNQSGFWSNEIPKKRSKQDILVVRDKKGIVCEGLYEVIKGKETGMKYCESVYVACLNNSKQLEIWNIQMVGACVSAWIGFENGERDDKGKLISSKHDVMKGAIIVAGMKEGKKGKTVYQIPVFTQRDIKPETEEKVLELDKKLQEYLKEYFAYNSSLPAESEKTETVAHNRASEALQPNDEFIPIATPEKSAKEIIAEKKAAAPPVIDEFDDMPF